MSEAEGDKLMATGEQRLTKFAPFTSSEEKQEKARDLFLKAATQYKAAGNWAKTADAFKRAADMSQKLKSDIDLADDLMNAGTAYRKAGDPRAEDVLNAVVDLYDKTGKYSQAAKVCTQIGDLGGETSDQWYSRAIRYMRNEGAKITSHDIVNKMVNRMIDNGRFENARQEYEKMAREYCDEHLTRGSAKKYFFWALLCTIAQVDKSNMTETVEILRGRFQEYQELDPQFNEYTREFILIRDIITAYDDDDYDAFGDAVAEFEEISMILIERYQRRRAASSGMKHVEGSGSSQARMQDSELPPLQSQPVTEDSGTPPSTTGADGGSFDCNICLELAQDPVVTLCGHLFCWPCLYRWLQVHSICQECPVCKASVEEEKVIPLYGRGKVGSVDPRTKTVPGMNIPHRPAGQRPDTARHAEQHFQHQGFNFMTGSGGPATARFGNITLSAGFGLFPSLFGFQLHGFPEATGLGGASGLHFGPAGAGPPNSHIHASPPIVPDQQQEALLSRLLLLLGCFVIVCLLLF